MLISNQDNNVVFNNIRYNNKIEKKPQKKDTGSFRSVNQNLNILKKQYNKNIDGLIRIVADNIVYTFFNIDSEQITELVTQYVNWPLSDIIKSFIVNYYIPHKNDNILKMLIMYNINKIVNSVVDIIEIHLIKSSGLISFNHDAFEYQIKLLRNQLEDKTKIINIKLSKLRDQINDQYDGEINDIKVNDDLDISIVNKHDDPQQAENTLRQNIQQNIADQYNKMLSDQGLSVVVIDKNQENHNLLNLDQIKNNQQQEKKFRQTVRNDILKQLGFNDIVLGD